jgi:hypothetical protein
LTLRAILSALGILAIVIAVVGEAARLDTQQSNLGESVKHVIEKLDSLLQGEAKRDVQVQDVKTDLHELRRDFNQQRVDEAVERGGEKQTTQPKRKGVPETRGQN